MGAKNTYKEKKQKKTKKKTKKLKSMSPAMGKLGSGIRQTLDGSFIIKYDVFRRLPFVLYIIFWAVVLIANGYNAEKKVRNIDSLNEEIDELRFEHIAVKSELMNYSRISHLATTLESTGLKVSMDPPYKIFVKDEE